jgi:hypothetical protein
MLAKSLVANAAKLVSGTGPTRATVVPKDQDDVEFEDRPDSLGLIDDKLLVPEAERRGAAGPFAPPTGGGNLVTYQLGGELSFEAQKILRARRPMNSWC